MSSAQELFTAIQALVPEERTALDELLREEEGKRWQQVIDGMNAVSKALFPNGVPPERLALAPVPDQPDPPLLHYTRPAKPGLPELDIDALIDMQRDTLTNQVYARRLVAVYKDHEPNTIRILLSETDEDGKRHPRQVDDYEHAAANLPAALDSANVVLQEVGEAVTL